MSFCLLALFCWFVFPGVQRVQAAPGELDAPNISIGGGSILTMVVQPDGKILIGGSFTMVGGVQRNKIARLAANGALDTSFDPNPNGIVESIVVQGDGKILIGGFFTALQPGGGGEPVTRRHIARLHANGTLDTGFDPNADREVLSMAVQSDGKVVIVGRFSTLQPNGATEASTRTRIARLNPDGTLEAGFAPDVVFDVYTLAMQEDGKILVAGDFTSIGGTFRKGTARLNADGTVDTTFNSSISSTVNSIAVQPDGKILIGGDGFGLARLDSNGERDTGFNPNANGRVYSMAIQADGKILIAGYFTALRPKGAATTTSRNHVARLHADGTLDMGFDPNANNVVGCVALQADGKILLGGGFSTLHPNGAGLATPRAGFARLLNDPATQGLAVPTRNQVSWIRGGSSPESARVTFELSTNKGMTWTMLGAGERVGSTARWQITGISLPSGGRVRARGATSDGNGSNGGLVESVANFRRLAARAEIAVFTGAGAASADERVNNLGVHLYPATAIGATGATQTFTVKNTGMANLTGLALTLSGTGPGDFVLGAPGATTLMPGATTTFTVAFAPTMMGVRSAVVNLASNDTDENPFTIALQGAGLAATNANLSSLSLSEGTLAPPFSADTSAYTASFPNTIRSISVTPAKAESNADIAVRLNGGSYTGVTSGSASGMLTLDAGENILDVRVTAQDGKTIKTYTIVVTRAGAIQGSLDPMELQVAGSLYTTIVQGDGKVIIAGTFNSVLGVPRSNIARLNADGTLDAGFNPNADGFISSVVLQPDGKILLGGSFTAFQPNGGGVPVARNGIARIDADGTLDPGFDPNANAGVSCIAMQADGKVLLGGAFTTLQPNGAVTASPRGYVARVNPDGSLDTGFDPHANSAVNTVAVQADGKVLLGGWFTTLQPAGVVAPTERNRIARVNADGSLDAGFDPNANNTINTVAVQANGMVLLGGEFTTLRPNGDVNATERNRIARVNADGTLDTAFDPNANSYVDSIALQADGKVLLGGGFTTLQPKGDADAIVRNRVARMNPDGTLDAEFDPNADLFVASVALQADGKVLLCGNFTWLRPNGAASGSMRDGFARLLNEPATQSLTVSSAGRIQWLRGGTSPEVEQVTFDLSTDSGASYSLLGAGSRIGGGWELSGIPVPAGQIRARGRTVNGRAGSSGGMVEMVTNHGIAALPEIDVSGNFISIANGDDFPALADHTDFGDVTLFGVGTSLTRVFTIANTGTADLTLGNVTISGPQAADFVVTSQPAPVVPASRSTSFAVTFSPGSLGPRDAIISFSNSDIDENHFTFGLRGTGFISSNADLSSLSLSVGTLAPDFSPAIDSYTVGVIFREDCLTVIPTKAETNASIAIRINGGSYTGVASGTASGTLALDVGENTVDLQVTAQDGATIKTYTVIVTRAAAGPGDLDPLDAGISGSSVHAIAVQPDGKTIIAGSFNAVHGVPRNNIARLDADGTLDAGFDPNADGDITSVVVQADGKILFGGRFTALQPNGASEASVRQYIARVNEDGSLDVGFDPSPNYDVAMVAVQADGKVLLGGNFTTLRPNGAATATTRNRIARINADGTLDTDFDPNANGGVSCIAMQADGKVLFGGRFTTLRPNGASATTARNRIARVNADGTLDTSFDPNADGSVSTLALQADGKVLLGGEFAALRPNGNVNVPPRNRVARVNADGTLDPEFDPNAYGSVSTLAIQADGKVLLGGRFTNIQPNSAATSTTRNFVARMNTDGTLDTGFNPSISARVNSIALQADGKILLGGDFTKVYSTPRNRFARLVNEPAIQVLGAVGNNRVNWARGGSSPEITQVSFELSVDGGSSYTFLGNGSRVGSTADWELTGLSLPATGQLRARGRTVDGNNSGLVEAVASFNGSGTPLETWRQSYFGSSANTGNGADGFDFDKDGLVNLIEFAFGLNPTRPDGNQLPQPRRTGGDFAITFEQPAGVGGISYGAEWSEDLATWTPVADAGTARQHSFSVPMAGKTVLFFRLRVTAP